MNNQMLVDIETRPSLKDGPGALLDEIYLARQWQKPAYLMALYRSPQGKDRSMREVANRLDEGGLSVYIVDAAKTSFGEFVRVVFEDSEQARRVYFIENLAAAGEQSRHGAWHTFYYQREGFDKRLLRAIFWLDERQLLDLVTNFPAYWEDRYRIFDLCEAGADTDPASNRPDADNNLSAQLMTESRENLRQGILAWRDNDPDGAHQYLQNATDLADVLGNAALQAECQKALALAFVEMGNTAEAIEAYEKIQTLQPEALLPWNNLGKLYLGVNNLPKAREAYKSALKRNPEDVVAWVGLASVYEKMNLLQESIGAYRKALRIVPDYPQALLNVGSVLEKINRFDKATRAYELLLAKDKNHQTAWQRLARVYGKQNLPEKAVNTLKSALEYLPASLELWMNLGEFAEGHNSALAAEAYRKALAINPRNGRAYSRLAEVQKSLGNIEDAVSCYEIGINFLEDDHERAKAWRCLLALLDEKDVSKTPVEAYQAPVQPAPAETLGEEKAPQAGKPALVEKFQIPEIHSHELSHRDCDRAGKETPEMYEPVHNPVLPIAGWKSNPAPRQPAEGATEMAFSPVPAWFKNQKTLEREINLLKRAHCAHGTEYDQVQLAMDAKREQPVADIWQPHKKHRANARKVEKFSMSPGKQNHNLVQTLAEMTGLTLKKLRGANDSDEKSAQSWIRQGKHLQKRGFYEDALVAFASAISDSPGNATAYINMGITFFLQSKYEHALTQFNKGIELTRDADEKSLAWNYVGDTYRRLHDKENAMRAYQKVSEIKNPRNALRQRAQQVLVFGNC
jgi:tetratricopeptide (TPR) repeat protein